MKLINLIFTFALVVLAGWRLGAQGSFHSDVVGPIAPVTSPEAEQSMRDREAANAQAEIANAQAERERQIAQQEAAQAKWDTAVARLTRNRDEALAKVAEENNPIVSSLEWKISGLKQKGADLLNERSQIEKDNAHFRAKQFFQPKDPWRILDGKIYNAKDTNWFQFTGKVLEVEQKGILVHGDFGPPLEAGFGERNYFVDNFPLQKYPVADGEDIAAEMNCVAHMGAQSIYRITNTTIDLQARTVRKLDYGNICDSPPAELVHKWENKIVFVDDDNSELTKKIEDNKDELSATEMKLAQLRNDISTQNGNIRAEYDKNLNDLPNVFARQAQNEKEARKQATIAKILAYNQGQAAKGDPIGLLRMGEFYRDGYGVPKDLKKAQEYLTNAANAGSVTAAEELAQMNQAPTDSFSSIKSK